MQGRRLRRVFHIASLLMDSRYGLTLGDIHERLGVHEASARTVRRDLDDLRGAGLLGAPFRQGGEVRHLWKRDAPGLTTRVTEDEFIALLVARSVMRSLRNTVLAAPLDRLLGKLEYGRQRAQPADPILIERRFLFRQTSHKTYRAQASMLRKLVRAVLEGRPVRVNYHGSLEPEPYQAAFDPLGVLIHDGNLYVVAQTRPEGPVVKLKLDRILECRMLRGHFQRPAGFRMNSVVGRSVGIIATDAPALEYRFRATGYAARNVTEDPWHETQRVTRRGRASIDFSVSVADETELVRRFLSLLPDVQILAPSSFRARLRRILRQSLNTRNT